MDWSAIIVALLAVVGSYAGNVALTRKKTREDAIRDAERETRQQVKMESIERKLDEHNKFGDKISSIEKTLITIQKDIEYLRKGKLWRKNS